MLNDPHALVVPDGTEVIEYKQYEKTGYERVFIPKSVMEIQGWAFSGCESLREVVFEEGSKLKTIRDRVFRSCSNLATINLPEGLKSIVYGVFADCTSLKHIQLPDGLEKIGAGCF